MSTSGELQAYVYNYETGRFTCEWEEDKNLQAPTVLYIPDMENLHKEAIKVTSGIENFAFKHIDQSPAGYLIIEPSGADLGRSLELTIKSPANVALSSSE